MTPTVTTVEVVRVGRHPDPMDFVPHRFQTWQGRYDDPEQQFRTLYTSAEEFGAWLEVMGRFRRADAFHDDVAAAGIVEQDDDAEPEHGSGYVPLSWLASRRVGRARVTGRAADATAADVLAVLADRLLPVARDHGYDDVDASVLIGPCRPVTQQAAAELHLVGADVIAYPSRHGTDHQCFAVLERPGSDLPVVEVTSVRSLNFTDPDFQRAVEHHQLRWA